MTVTVCQKQNNSVTKGCISSTEEPVLVDLSLHLYLKESSHSFKANCFERGVKEAIFIKLEQPSLNRRGLRHSLSPVYNCVLKPRPRQ